jgi:hypothetical protein
MHGKMAQDVRLHSGEHASVQKFRLVFMGSGTRRDDEDQ